MINLLICKFILLFLPPRLFITGLEEAYNGQSPSRAPLDHHADLVTATAGRDSWYEQDVCKGPVLRRRRLYVWEAINFPIVISFTSEQKLKILNSGIYTTQSCQSYGALLQASLLCQRLIPYL